MAHTIKPRHKQDVGVPRARISTPLARSPTPALILSPSSRLWCPAHNTVRGPKGERSRVDSTLLSARCAVGTCLPTASSGLPCGPGLVWSVLPGATELLAAPETPSPARLVSVASSYDFEADSESALPSPGRSSGTLEPTGSTVGAISSRGSSPWSTFAKGSFDFEAGISRPGVFGAD
jgi:hypothetical protein